MPVIRSRPLALMLLASAAVMPGFPTAPARAEDATVFGAPALPSGTDWFGKQAAPPAAAAPPPPAAAVGASGGWLPERTAPSKPSDSAGGDGPNLSALRFFAAQNDLARVAAEIRLLRAKYPNWEPPTDLFTATSAGGVDEQPLWDLFGKHDLAGLKDAIAERQARTPGWQPSADLSAKLAQALAADDLVRASDAKDYGSVLDIAAAHRDLLTCDRVDAIWRSAEALAATGDQAHAADAYRYVLANCTNPQERLATVQKASAVLTSPEAVAQLVHMGRRRPDGTDEFADLRLDTVRARIGQAMAAKTAAAPADLDEIGARARLPGNVKDAELLGWYALGQKDFAGAETWFHTALQGGPAPKPAEGLVLALRDGGKGQEALAAAQQYGSLAPGNRKLLTEMLVANLDKAPLGPDQIKTLGAAIDADQGADAAQALGWHQFKAGAVAEAADWFRKSLGWQPSEPAAVGQVVTAARLKQPAVVAATVAQYGATYPHVQELAKMMSAADRPHPRGKAQRQVASARPAGRRGGGGSGGGWDQGATDIVSTFESGHVDQALAMMDARRATKAEPNGLAVVRGWALYKKGDWEGARQVFNDVGRHGMPDEAGKGLRQIDLGYTNPRYR